MSESLLDKIKTPTLDVYFDSAKGKYWVLTGNEYVPFNKDDVRVKLAKLGWSTRRGKFGEYSDVEMEINRIQEENAIHFVGEISGFGRGIFEYEGHKFLVPKSRKRLIPEKGSWETIRIIGIRVMGEEQFNYVLGWHQGAVKAVYEGDRRPGQLLVLAGPARCGKSFWQNRIITPLLGGSVARPLQYMMGTSAFNADLVSATHLMLEDEMSSTDIKSRRNFGANIKNYTVNTVQRIHPKGREAFYVPSLHRLTLSVNDEAENLSILPPLDESLMDKIMLIKCEDDFPFSTKYPGATEALEKQVAKELPCFIHYLLHEHVIEETLRSERFCVSTFMHPDLVEKVDGLSPEMELHEMIQSAYFADKTKASEVKTTAAEIQMQLEGYPGMEHRARRLLSFSTACGVYLGRLALRARTKRFYERAAGLHGSRPWFIRRHED